MSKNHKQEQEARRAELDKIIAEARAAGQAKAKQARLEKAIRGTIRAYNQLRPYL